MNRRLRGIKNPLDQFQADSEILVLVDVELSFLPRRGIASGHLCFDPLHHAGAGAILARGLQNTLTGFQRCADCSLPPCVDPRPTDRLTALGALVSRPGKPGMDPFLNDRALELSKDAEHLKECPPARRGCINGLLFEIKIAPNGAEFAKKADEIL